MIINTGMRTDIPAYYSKWFYNRIGEGYVYTRNPYNPTRITKYLLSPDVVDCLSFCTKNPEPMLQRMKEISHFKQFWFVTITPYGRDIEPNVPEIEKVIESVKKLSGMVGANAVGWRYDPIFVLDKYTLEYHIDSFEKMAESLSGYVNSCVISFIDLYAKTIRNFPEVKEVSSAQREVIGREFVRIGSKYGIPIRSCCEGSELQQFGVDISGCMTQEMVEKAIGCSLSVPKKKSLREGCNCLLGNDIGAYNTCAHACLYCYANYDREIVRQNMMLHDPDSPLLIGTVNPEDVICNAKQESYLDGQYSIFL